MKMTPLAVRMVLPLVTALLAGFAGRAAAQTNLKDSFQNDFPIGVAISLNQIYEVDHRGTPLIKTQFNSISPENVLKWESIHPLPDRFDFEAPDRYVAFGESNHMIIVGHTLVWHSQTPRWVFQDATGKPLNRDALLNRMSNHIHTVVGRYKGRIKIWDVVNEALYDNGTMCQSPWFKIIGEDYIEKAFQFAHEADPDAVLRYNDYSLENTNKLRGAIRLIKNLQARGVPVTAIGLQDHVKMDWPTPEQEDATIEAFAHLGLKVMITELDVDVLSARGQNRSADIQETARQTGPNLYSSGLPASVQQALAKRYADLFKVYIRHRDVIKLVTFWGVTDGDSWLNRPGRVNYPLLFDREGQPKPAFEAVIRTATQN